MFRGEIALRFHPIKRNMQRVLDELAKEDDPSFALDEELLGK
jgi:hypothetical protein